MKTNTDNKQQVSEQMRENLTFHSTHFWDRSFHAINCTGNDKLTTTKTEFTKHEQNCTARQAN